MNGQRKLVAVVLAAGLLFTAGCGDKDKKTVTGANGEKVSVDDDGGVSIDDGKGNKVEIDDDGNYNVTDGDGNTSASTGDNTKLPEDWPDDLKPPKSVKLVSALTTTSDGKKSLMATGGTDASAKDLYEGIKTQLENADYEISGDNFYSGSSGDGGTLTATGKDWDVSVLIGSSTTDMGPDTPKTSITVTLTEAAG